MRFKIFQNDLIAFAVLGGIEFRGYQIELTDKWVQALAPSQLCDLGEGISLCVSGSASVNSQ